MRLFAFFSTAVVCSLFGWNPIVVLVSTATLVAVLMLDAASKWCRAKSDELYAHAAVLREREREMREAYQAEQVRAMYMKSVDRMVREASSAASRNDAFIRKLEQELASGNVPLD